MTTINSTMQNITITHDAVRKMFNMSQLTISVQGGLITSLVLTFFTLHALSVWKQRHLYIKSWNVQGPLPLPFIGAMYLFLIKPEYILNKITRLHKSYNGFFKLWFGRSLLYFISEPEHIDKVLNNPRTLQKDYFYKHLSDSIGFGLMTAPVPKWKKHRKTITPAFNQKILDSFVEVFAQQSTVCAEILQNLENKDNVNIYGILTRCTLEVLCETALGVKMNVQKANADYGETFDKIMELTFLKIFRPWYHFDFIWSIAPISRTMRSKLKKFNALTDKVINEKKIALENKRKEAELTADVEETTKRMAFLDLIMENSNFTSIETREEISLFLFAGTDTTASALSFLFTVLGMYPDVQQKVYEEVVDIMGHDRDPLPEDLPKMKYTDRVIKETLRLFPVGAFFLRAITEDIELENGVMLPNGSSVFFGALYIHRNAKYWPNPLKFDPDRFLPEEIAKRHPCTYIAFSQGPRNCIGMRYAIMNMKVVIATLVRKLKFYSSHKCIEDVKLKANIVLRFRDGPKMRIESREE